MSVFVLKGVMIDATPKKPGRLKQRIFEATSFPGFINTTYDVIGVEFGLGIMELSSEEIDSDENASIKIQTWNLNEQKQRLLINWKNFLKGSRFCIITCVYESKQDLERLSKTLLDVKDACPSISFGIVIQLKNPKGSFNLPFETIGTLLDVKPAIVENMDDLMVNLIISCITDTKNKNFIMAFSTMDEIHNAESIENPFIAYLGKASLKLIDLLESADYHIQDDNTIEFKTKDHLLKVNLNNSSLYVSARSCVDCAKKDDCNNRFSRVCVVLQSQIKYGYSSNAAALSPCDLFILSLIYSVEQELLPKSVRSQFPSMIRRRSCFKESN